MPWPSPGWPGPSAPPASPATQTTAYVLRHVQNAVAPTSVGHLVGISRMVFPPGVTQQPVAGGLRGGSTAGGGSPWSVAYLLHWDYQGSQKYSAYGLSGQRVFDLGISVASGSVTFPHWLDHPLRSSG